MKQKIRHLRADNNHSSTYYCCSLASLSVDDVQYIMMRGAHNTNTS